ncbi:hypothetical protein [Enterococcus mundtii]|uniref:hypothetical protein n=1 Tax=Enterococcus mundtii TaxID=53346 RepID=UPI000BB54960|nr:hypothetical protein [Enterococcus mundtii]
MKEKYLVVDRGFYDETHGIPAHYQIKVEKATKPVSPLSNNTTNINASGNAKVNFQSTDNSITISLTQEETKQFDELYNAIESISNSTKILEVAKELQDSEKSPSFKEKYIDFMSVTADHMTVLAPFIPFLTGLIPYSNNRSGDIETNCLGSQFFIKKYFIKKRHHCFQIF